MKLELEKTTTDTVIYLDAGVRLVRKQCGENLFFAVEELRGELWIEVDCWDDVGSVAGMLVKQGVAVDHDAAFAMLKGGAVCGAI